MDNKKLPTKLNEIYLVYRSKTKAKDRPQIKDSKEAHCLLQENWSDQIETIEEFNVLLLDRSNRVLALSKMFKGGTSATVVDIKLVFATAIKGRADSVILAHNHPSGNLKPSTRDIELTKQFKKAGELLEIKVLDHLILSPDGGYYSFADENLL
jgi:DNA repair protein RadC